MACHWLWHWSWNGNYCAYKYSYDPYCIIFARLEFTATTNHTITPTTCTTTIATTTAIHFTIVTLSQPSGTHNPLHCT